MKIRIGIGVAKQMEFSKVKLTIAYTVTQFVFKFKLPSTQSIIIHWGDGNSEEVTGQDSTIVTKTSAYASPGTYQFYVTGDYLGLTHIDIQNHTFVSGDVAKFSQLTALTYLRIYNTGVSGDVSGWGALTSLTYLHAGSSSISGDISGWTTLTSLTYIRMEGTGVSGDIGPIGAALSSCTVFFFNLTSVSFTTTPAWSQNAATVYLQDNAFTSTEVDDALAALAGGPITNSTIYLNGTNAARTSASDADAATINGNGNTLYVNT